MHRTLAEIDARLREIETTYPDESTCPDDVLREYTALCAERRKRMAPLEREQNRRQLEANRARHAEDREALDRALALLTPRRPIR